MVNVRPVRENTVLWLEDHIDNKDGRTYNVTSEIALHTTKGKKEYIREGSPLRAGLHHMKLHVKGGAHVDHFSLELMKPHRTSPKMMKQKMDGSKWEVVWSDEFDQPEIDTSKWDF